MLTQAIIPGLNDFVGRWRISRGIDDKRAGQTGQFEGEASFSSTNDGLNYSEKGQLMLNGQVFSAERQYLWKAVPDGIEVSFSDGRYFHTINAENTHWCDPDRYSVEYHWTKWPTWSSIWTVSGPRKDYVMRSNYSRF